MRFEEEGNILTFTSCENNLVYFLLQKGEVVYVGKTTAGMARPYAHYDKEYDTIKVLVCEPKSLDKIEDYYICKYKPKYNKVRNYNVICSLDRAKRLIKEKHDPRFSKWVLRRALADLKITPFIDEYTQSECITAKEYEDIVAYVERGVC